MPDVGRKAPEGKTHTQSMRFKEAQWTKSDSKKWVKGHDGYVDGYERSENEHRWRQYDPDNSKFHYRQFDKNLPAGVYFIVGYPGAEERKNKMKQGIFMREIKAESKDAVIDIIGVIGWEIWYPAFRDMLKAIPDTIERVIFEIYSPGGDVWEGNAIIQLIGAMKQETIARVQMAASMATLIAVACKTREIAANGRWLIHNPWAVLMGDAASFEKRAKELRDCEAEFALFYANRTGQTVEKMIGLMAEERWLTPVEAKELGFVNSINDSFNAAEYAAVKAEIVAAGKWPKALAEMPFVEIKPPVSAQGATPGKMEENKNANAAAPGGPGAGDVPPALPARPADGAASATIPVAVSAITPDYERGHAEGKIAGEADHVAKLGAIAVNLTDLKTRHDALDVLQRKMQGERDSARAQVEKLTATCKEATAKLERLLGGGMRFTPAIDTFEDAVKVCGGNATEARIKYKQLYEESRAQAKQNRK